jgi:hypothetical protein
MQTLTLSLLTEAGDELGRLPMSDVAALPVGASAGSPVREQLEIEMDQLCAAIERAVEHQSLTLAVDPLGLRVAVSRALLLADGPDVVLSLPVAPISAVPLDREAGDDSGSTGLTDRGRDHIGRRFGRENDSRDSHDSGAAAPDVDWDDLFEPLGEEAAE